MVTWVDNDNLLFSHFELLYDVKRMCSNKSLRLDISRSNIDDYQPNFYRIFCYKILGGVDRRSGYVLYDPVISAGVP